MQREGERRRARWEGPEVRATKGEERRLGMGVRQQRDGVAATMDGRRGGGSRCTTVVEAADTFGTLGLRRSLEGYLGRSTDPLSKRPGGRMLGCKHF